MTQPAATGSASSNGQGIVQVGGLEKYFGRLHVLRGIDLSVRQGEAVMIIGRSGSGKSTLLRCINFLEEPTVGWVEVDGMRVEADPLHSRSNDHREQMRQIRLRAGMLFQDFNLFPHLSVLQNCIEAPTLVKKVPRDEANATAEKYLDKVGLLDKRDEYPSRLSGGQKQRVAIARALAMQPRGLLCDEITSALDPELKNDVLDVLVDLKNDGLTMILVTHEIGFARRAADRVVVLCDGRILEEGPPADVLDKPKTERMALFLKRVMG
jgi:ABC-type polar amino acid transport system ATPase subunit